MRKLANYITVCSLQLWGISLFVRESFHLQLYLAHVKLVLLQQERLLVAIRF